MSAVLAEITIDYSVQRMQRSLDFRFVATFWGGETEAEFGGQIGTLGGVSDHNLKQHRESGAEVRGFPEDAIKYPLISITYDWVVHRNID